jgi:hypothetical protein
MIGSKRQLGTNAQTTEFSAAWPLETDREWTYKLCETKLWRRWEFQLWPSVWHPLSYESLTSLYRSCRFHLQAYPKCKQQPTWLHGVTTHKLTIY